MWAVTAERQSSMDSFQQPGVKAVNADRCNHSAEKA